MTISGPFQCVCPACRQRKAELIDENCPVCRGYGKLTLGWAALDIYDPQTVAYAVALAYEEAAEDDLGSVFAELQDAGIIHRPRLPQDAGVVHRRFAAPEFVPVFVASRLPLGNRRRRRKRRR